MGMSDLAFSLAVEDTYPSFGFMLRNGATTLWEAWADESSHIHHFFGSVDNFFYRYLAGINLDPDSGGFGRILITPQFTGGLKFAAASYRSIRGRISSSWKKEGESDYTLDVEIPANCTAEIRLPGAPSGVKVNGRNIRPENGIIATQSGNYHLEIKL
jgi:alpha-L-rhamnosidase